MVDFPIPEPTDHEGFCFKKNVNREGFDLTKYHHILEYGCNEGYFSTWMASLGKYVVGIDCRPFYRNPYRDTVIEKANFLFIQGNASEIMFQDIFELVVSVSAIEHFGCGFYGEKCDLNGDMKAMRNSWYALKEGGICIVTVPITDKEHYFVDQGYIRRYNLGSLMGRIIGGYVLEYWEVIPSVFEMQQQDYTPQCGYGIETLKNADFSKPFETFHSPCIYLEMRKDSAKI